MLEPSSRYERLSYRPAEDWYRQPPTAWEADRILERRRDPLKAAVLKEFRGGSTTSPHPEASNSSGTQGVPSPEAEAR